MMTNSTLGSLKRFVIFTLVKLIRCLFLFAANELFVIVE
jgi:hypothetical protein